MSITKKTFGRLPCGCEAELYTIRNASGAYVCVSSYGGIVTKIVVPDKDGKLGDVVLGYDTLEGYAGGNPGYLGALIGRVGNRIAGAKCELNGQTLTLAGNEDGTHLHGGNVGFDKKLWHVEPVGEDSLALTYVSADGEENYPGELSVKVTYTFTEKNELKIHYEAASTKDTLINLTNHSYFNIDGDGAGDVFDQTLAIFADHITEVDEKCIPDGVLMPVDGTVFDLRKGARIGDGMKMMGKDKQLDYGQGYDHNFVVNGEGFRKFAVLTSGKSGRVMEVYSDQPAVQFYAANMLEGTPVGKCGRAYQPHDALCLETQVHPDAIHHPNFPSCVLRAGEKYDTLTVYAFSTAK